MSSQKKSNFLGSLQYSPIAPLFLRSIVQKLGKLKNRKPILQTKAQKRQNNY